MTRIIATFALLLAIIAGGSAPVSASGEEYIEHVDALSSTMNSIIEDASTLGWTQNHIEEIIAVQAQAYLDVTRTEVPECLSYNRELLIDALVHNLAGSGYVLYIYTADVGEPLSQADTEALLKIVNEPHQKWLATGAHCGPTG